MSGRYTFKRMNGEEFTVHLEIDERALADFMQRGMTMRGKRVRAIADGSIKAYIPGEHVR